MAELVTYDSYSSSKSLELTGRQEKLWKRLETKPKLPACCALHRSPLPDMVQWPSCPDLFTLPKVGWTPGFPGSVQSQCLREGKKQWDVNMWTQHEVATTLKVAVEVWGTGGGWTGHQEQPLKAHYRNSTNDEAPLTGALLLFRIRGWTQPGSEERTSITQKQYFHLVL